MKRVCEDFNTNTDEQKTSSIRLLKNNFARIKSLQLYHYQPLEYIFKRVMQGLQLIQVRIKILVLIFITTSVCAVQLNAQLTESLKAQKAAFITESIQLSPTESQLFWPVYNEYQAKKNEINIERRKILTQSNTASPEIAKKLSDEYVTLLNREAELVTQYHYKFIRAISPEKVLKFYQAEDQFKVYLLKKLKTE